MATEATNFNEAVQLIVPDSNRLNKIINGTSTEEVQLDDGSYVPSVRKSMVENLKFLPPIDWVVGEDETVFNQLRLFTDGSWWYAENARPSTPVPMGVSPYNDSNWVLSPLNTHIIDTLVDIQGEWIVGSDVKKGQLWTYQGYEWRSLTGVSVEPSEGVDWRKNINQLNLAETLEKSLGVNARIWPKDRSLTVGDAVPSAQETVDGLPITHLIVDNNVYIMSNNESGLVTEIGLDYTVVAGVKIHLVSTTKKALTDVAEFFTSFVGDSVKLVSYHKPSTNAELPYTLSGGDFVYCALPKSLHNGGTIISPTVPCSTPFTNQTLVDFLSGTGETEPSGTGVWLKVDSSINLANFGADPFGKLYCDKVFQHTVNAMYTTSDGITGTGVTIYITPGLYLIEYPLVYDKDYIKLIASGESETVIWKPNNAVRTDLGTNTAPLRVGVVDSYDVDAMVIYTHPDDGFRFGSEVRGVRFSGKSDDPAQSLTSYREFGIYAPRTAQCTHSNISATRIAKLYYTFDTFKHTADDLVSNFGGGIFYYVKDSSGTVASGTSLVANNCWASRPLTEAGLFLAAYEIEGLEYSTMTACSSDNMFEPWRLKSSNIDISSGSTEISRSLASLSIKGGNYTITNWRSVSPAQELEIQIDIKGGAKVKFNGGELSGKTNPQAGDVGVRVSDGSEVVFNQFEFPTTGTPYEFDFTGVTPAKSVVIHDSYGVSQEFSALIPEGVYNVPARSVSQNNLQDANHSINRIHKSRGRQAIITTTNQSVFATGNEQVSSWVDSQGVIVVTPS